jgi:hypothetical protein
VDLRVQRKERTTVKEEQSQTEKEKDPLKISLSAIAEDYHHPKQLQESSGGVYDQANVNQRTHGAPLCRILLWG